MPGESVRAANVLLFDHSGIITEWHHTGRPLIRLTDVVADRELAAVGLTTDRLRIETVDRLFAEGYPDSVAERRERVLDRFGVPMDGRAGERAATRIPELADGRRDPRDRQRPHAGGPVDGHSSEPTEDRSNWLGRVSRSV